MICLRSCAKKLFNEFKVVPNNVKLTTFLYDYDFHRIQGFGWDDRGTFANSKGDLIIKLCAMTRHKNLLHQFVKRLVIPTICVRFDKTNNIRLVVQYAASDIGNQIVFEYIKNQIYEHCPEVDMGENRIDLSKNNCGIYNKKNVLIDW